MKGNRVEKFSKLIIAWKCFENRILLLIGYKVISIIKNNNRN